MINSERSESVWQLAWCMSCCRCSWPPLFGRVETN